MPNLASKALKPLVYWAIALLLLLLPRPGQLGAGGGVMGKALSVSALRRTSARFNLAPSLKEVLLVSGVRAAHLSPLSRAQTESKRDFALFRIAVKEGKGHVRRMGKWQLQRVASLSAQTAAAGCISNWILQMARDIITKFIKTYFQQDDRYTQHTHVTESFTEQTCPPCYSTNQIPGAPQRLPCFTDTM